MLTLKEFFSETINIFHSNHPFMMLAHDMATLLAALWDYQIYTTSDKQTILISNVVMGIILFIFGFKTARRLSQHVRRKLPRNLDKGTANILERVSYYFFLIVITIFVLDIANVPLTAFTVLGTTIALGVGLGSQNMANNFISGLIILFERPIKLGDIIEVKHIIGKVINIGARCVSIKTPENIIMLIPNSNILQDVVINWTHEDNMLKAGLIFEVNNACKIDKFDSLLTEVMQNNKDVLKQPAPKILLKTINKDSYTVEVWFWIHLDSNDDSKFVINDINRSLINLSKKHKVQIISEREVERPAIKSS